jgi:hypothetical protein
MVADNNVGTGSIVIAGKPAKDGKSSMFGAERTV